MSTPRTDAEEGHVRTLRASGSSSAAVRHALWLARELERELNDLKKRLEYLSIEVSFANQKRDEWKAMSARLRDSLLDCQGHISGAHPHWKEACRAVIAYEVMAKDSPQPE